MHLLTWSSAIIGINLPCHSFEKTMLALSCWTYQIQAMPVKIPKSWIINLSTQLTPSSSSPAARINNSFQLFPKLSCSVTEQFLMVIHCYGSHCTVPDCHCSLKHHLSLGYLPRLQHILQILFLPIFIPSRSSIISTIPLLHRLKKSSDKPHPRKTRKTVK